MWALEDGREAYFVDGYIYDHWESPCESKRSLCFYNFFEDITEGGIAWILE